MTKSREVANVANDETLQALQESYPMEQGGQRILLPRLGMVSQDVVEGKGKSMKVTTEAGTFFIETQSDEENEEGKRIWNKDEIGAEIEGIILFQRRQLRMYDEKTEQYTSSPVYDSDDEVVPLFCNKEEVGRGTVSELQAKYEYTDKNTGKVRSKLEINRILYVEYKGEVYQMNLRGSSMFSFLSYSRKVLPPSVITVFSSEPRKKGTIEWNQMTFDVKRKLSDKEAQEILHKVSEIKRAVQFEKDQYSAVTVEVIEQRKKVEDEYNSI